MSHFGNLGHSNFSPMPSKRMLVHHKQATSVGSGWQGRKHWFQLREREAENRWEEWNLSVQIQTFADINIWMSA